MTVSIKALIVFMSLGTAAHADFECDSIAPHATYLIESRLDGVPIREHQGLDEYLAEDYAAFRFIMIGGAYAIPEITDPDNRDRFIRYYLNWVEDACREWKIPRED